MAVGRSEGSEVRMRASSRRHLHDVRRGRQDNGFIVDHVGVGHHLKRAIDNYDEREHER